MAMRPEQALRDQVLAFLERGDIRHAGPAAERLVARFPEYAPGRAAFSEVWLRCGRADRARDEAAAALRLAPESPDIVSHYAKCLVFAGEEREARAMAEDAMALGPQDFITLDTLGNVFSRLGDQERALTLFREAHDREPENTTAMFNLATSLRFFGNNDEAEALFDRIIERDPDDYQALHSRSILRRQTDKSNHVDDLQARLAAGPSWPAASHIAYALGKERDDLGQTAEAFAAYRHGAELMRQHVPDDLEASQADIEAAMAALENNLSPSSDAAGYDSAEPVFVIGLPRTGSTLIERILGAHPEVFAAGELYTFRFEAQRLIGGRAPAEVYRRLAESPDLLDAGALGRAYIDGTRPRTGRTAHFVDKMPRNVLWAPLIHRVMPNARFILTERDPMDTGYALFRTLFNRGYHFSYDLERIGRYLIAHQRLTEALKSALPQHVLLPVRYEDLVEEPGRNARAFVEHCGLEWREDLLAFHQREGAVTTASAHQVRRPIYTSSVGKWRAVAEQLELLRRTLAEGGIGPTT
ncbi:tetratricopeptide repeat-containing sulfotransferase family protein [Wenzhouxiangella sp. EGI_FJ10305]|uniref:tetratricopeptide repeat-containing sulfotransferase family protein n=1 Tax=Wenzhouxiangella sp. EGI_FJ10305 TaxID=3243768 RepID=UPI0035DF4DE9